MCCFKLPQKFHKILGRLFQEHNRGPHAVGPLSLLLVPFPRTPPEVSNRQSLESRDVVIVIITRQLHPTSYLCPPDSTSDVSAGLLSEINNLGTQSPSLVEAKVDLVALDWHYLYPCFSQNLCHTPTIQDDILGMLLDPHSLARKPMERFALVDTLPSIGPIAIREREDSQLHAGAYALPAWIRMQGPDPVCLRLFQEPLSQRLTWPFPIWSPDHFTTGIQNPLSPALSPPLTSS